jgi:hypothetical protein
MERHCEGLLDVAVPKAFQWPVATFLTAFRGNPLPRRKVSTYHSFVVQEVRFYEVCELVIG